MRNTHEAPRNSIQEMEFRLRNSIRESQERGEKPIKHYMLKPLIKERLTLQNFKQFVNGPSNTEELQRRTMFSHLSSQRSPIRMTQHRASHLGSLEGSQAQKKRTSQAGSPLRE